MLELQGTAGTDVPLTGAANVGDSGVTTGDNSAFSDDDMVYVGSTANWTTAFTETPTRGQISRVHDLYFTTALLLDSKIYGDLHGDEGYLVADSAFVRLITPVENVTISGITFEPYPDTTGEDNRAIQMDMVAGIRVTGCEFITAHDTAIHIEHASGVTVQGCAFTENATYESVQSRTYPRVGITLLGASRDVLVHGCGFERVFNGVQIAGGGEGTARQIRVVDCAFNGLKGWGGVNADCGGENIHVRGCVIDSKMVSHYTDGNPPPVEDNAGLRFRASHDTHITNCTFDGAPLGIRLEATQDVKINHSSFADVGVGIFVEAGDTDINTGHLTVSHNHFHRLAVTGNMHPEMISAAVFVWPSTDTVDLTDFNLIHNDVGEFTAACFYFRGAHLHNLRIADNTFDDNGDTSGAAPIVWRDTTTFDVSLQGNMARDIGGSQTIEREIGTVDHTRIRRRENRTVGCDEYWDNDGITSEARVCYPDNSNRVGALNPDRIRENWGGLLEVGTPNPGDWSYSNEEMGCNRLVLRLYETPDSRMTSIEADVIAPDYAHEWDPDTATWSAITSETIIVKSPDQIDVAGDNSVSRNWFADGSPPLDSKIWWIGSERPVGGVTRVDGSVNVNGVDTGTLTSLWKGHGFDADRQLFRVTRVGWRARTDVNPVQMRDFYFAFRWVTHTSGTPGATAPYDEILLNTTDITVPRLTRAYWELWKDVDILIDGRIGEFCYVRWYAESNTNNQWDDIELFINYKTDFRISDRITVT
jgi:hypothetical protein